MTWTNYEQEYGYDRKVFGSFVARADHTWEGYHLDTERTASGNNSLVTASVLPQKTVDISWLKAAAKVYHTSADPKDFVFAEVPACQADLPNRNFDIFTYDELVKFRPIIGCMTYKSYIGRMTSKNHDNKDPAKAKGICFDAQMRKINGHWHVMVVAGFDRSKDAKLAKHVLSNKNGGYSMACLIGYDQCTVCGFAGRGGLTCKHVLGGRGKGRVLADGSLVCTSLFELNFWELSQVDDRADFDCIQSWAN